MKIGIFFEGKGKHSMGGGFYLQTKPAMILNKINKKNLKIEFLISDKESELFLKEKGYKTNFFKYNLFSKYFSKLYTINYINDLFQKLNISHPFAKFLKKESYNLVIFIGPSSLAKYCGKTSFVFNIWDLDHKKNSQFPEHNYDYAYEKREKLISDVIYRAFKIVVPHAQNKQDLVKIYSCPEKNINVQTLIPMPPTIYKEGISKGLDYNKIFNNLNLPKDKKLIFYPAAYWAHKNHKYIIDTANILIKKNINKFVFIFCGTDKGNYSYVKKLVDSEQLHEVIKILPLVSDDELISIYKNIDAVVMPTYGGPTNFPIYEAFFFKKLIFYTKDLLHDEEILKNLIEIDTSNPDDFLNKLEILSDDQKLKDIVESAYSYYNKVCDEENLKNNYIKIIEEFEYLTQRWKKIS